MCVGLHFAWPSPSLPQLLHEESHIPITSDEGSWLAVAFLFGGAFGSILAGTLLDLLGRKNVILLAGLPLLLSWLMIAFAGSLPVLLAARFIAGLGGGLTFCAVPMYLAEISDPKIRGLLGCGLMVTNLFGNLLINVLGPFLSISNTALICCVFPVLLFLTFSWMPESPYSSVMKGDVKGARRSLIKFFGTEDVEDDLGRISEAIEEQNKDTGKCLDLFTVRSNRRALLVVLGMRAIQQLCGISAFVFYAQTVFEEAGDVISPIISTSVFFSVQIVIAAVSSVTVDRIGRRPLLMVSISGSAMTLLLEGVYFTLKSNSDVDVTSLSWVPIVLLIIFVIMFNIGMLTIPLLLVGEVFPTNVKSFAFSFGDLCFCVFASAVSKFFQMTKDEFGIQVPFLTFTVCSILGLFFIVFYVPETKGKTLEQIQHELKEK